eukprot:TRINITY_DN91663_c0_g1_i1.p1 TRINITY_DN91663_c0_g1~~TRINITY_DN91663_c0_g1_i1.p1  ORF type:complete len:527 (-),score=139.39 TRINITY_DN91663_c0_g1_i1:189-1769(-)
MAAATLAFSSASSSAHGNVRPKSAGAAHCRQQPLHGPAHSAHPLSLRFVSAGVSALVCPMLKLRSRLRSARSCRRAKNLRQLGGQLWDGLLRSQLWDRRSILVPDLLESLEQIYETKLRPLEQHLQFERFYDSAELCKAYFASKPFVMVLGQYSTGKSTLLTRLLQADYPGVRIGPEPTTDKFMAIMSGSSRQLLPGFALCSDPSKPFGQLQRFGSNFLERFEGAYMPEEEVPALGSLSFIDSPGVLSGDKQRVGRSYDFEGVMGWFADNADLVMVLFDPNKLDISDEFRRCLEALSRSERKVRFILNKAEHLDRFEMVRVFGALMWSLSKVYSSPEMPHVFVSALSAAPEDMEQEAADFFAKEEAALRQEILQVPLDGTTRKVNDLLRRGRLLRCHALLVEYLLELRGPFGRRKVLRETVADPVRLAAACEEVAQKHGIPLRDFPSTDDLSAKFQKLGDKSVQHVPPALIRNAEEALSTDIPALLQRVAAEREEMLRESPAALESLRGTGSGGDKRGSNVAEKQS